jgi:hypothetical protein
MNQKVVKLLVEDQWNSLRQTPNSDLVVLLNQAHMVATDSQLLMLSQTELSSLILTRVLVCGGQLSSDKKPGFGK